MRMPSFIKLIQDKQLYKEDIYTMKYSMYNRSEELSSPKD